MLNLLEKEKDKDELVTTFSAVYYDYYACRFSLAVRNAKMNAFMFHKKREKELLRYIIGNRTTTINKYASCRFPFVFNTVLSFSFIQK